MRKYVLIACLLMVAAAHAQYNNEWIDYSKTYYKFKVGQTGLYRINQDALNALGLGNTPSEQFQLWRNGQEVPVYITVAAGALPAGGYIEFWGEMNDGKPDRALYKNQAYQLADTYSLETDTAVYFLTVNTSGNNKRFVNTTNDVAIIHWHRNLIFYTLTGRIINKSLMKARASILGKSYILLPMIWVSFGRPIAFTEMMQRRQQLLIFL